MVRIPLLHSVEWKFVVAMLAILSVAVVTITALYVVDIRSENRREAELDLAADARLREAEIEAALRTYGRDVLTLVNTPPVSAILRTAANRGVDPESDDSYEVWRTRLATIFAAFAMADRAYLQLRYLDASGAEVVRVNNEDGAAVRVPDDELQDKSGREYFTAVRDLADGEVYVSSLDLNIEDRRLEEPGVPVVRFAMPVFDPGGRFAGAVVTNVAASALLAPLKSQGRVTAYLVDGGGQYLSHPDESRRFGAISGAGLASDVGPEAAAELTSGAGLLTAAGSMFARTPVEFAGLSTANEWWVVEEIALADIPGANVTKPIAAAAVLLLVAGVVGYWVARGVARELQESEERFRAVFETSYDGVIAYDAELRYRLWSPAMERMMGVPAEDVLGQRPADIFPFLDQTEEGNAMREALGDVATHTPRVPYEVRGTGANGYAETTHLPVRDASGRVIGGMAIIRDVTERVQAEEALRESEERYRTLVETSLDGIIVSDSRQLITFANRAASEMFRYAPGEMHGLHAHQLIHRGDRGQLEDWRRVMASNEPAHREYGGKRIRKDGSTFLVEVSVSPLLKDGDSAGSVVAVRDVSERVQAETALRESEEELRRLNRELEQRVRGRTSELEAANRELEAFSYSVSHDLRAPLRAVDGFTQAVLADHGDALEEEGRRLLGRVRRASGHMGELIDDLLKLARVAMVDMRREPVDLTALARDLARPLFEGSGGRDIDVVVEHGLHAVGDANLVRVLLGCLLDNAFKFTRPTLAARIQVGETRVDGQACFFVRDNGAGFDMRYVHQLFQPFQRLHTADEFDGTGIGLATVKRIVNRHGGDAWAEGEVGKGATMFFTLSGADDA